MSDLRTAKTSFWKALGINPPYKPMGIVLRGVSNKSLPPFTQDDMEYGPDGGVMFNFLINPSSMQISFGHIINYTYTRGGWVIEFSGEELTKMSCSLNTAAFRDDNLGLTSESAWKSPGFRNLMHFVDLYRSNGRTLIASTPTGTGSEGTYIQEDSLYKGNNEFNFLQRINNVGELFIIYDFVHYFGYFERMSMSQNSDKPFYMEFSFDFAITHMIENYRQIKGVA